MRRVPILKTVYEPQYDKYRCDPSINPYNAASSFVSHDEWTNGIFNYIGQIIKFAFIDSNVELADAMGAIIRARAEGRERDATAAYATLSEMGDLSIENLTNDIIPTLHSKDVLKIAGLQGKIREKYRLQYLLAKKVADGGF
jgi:hypothetical protein